jgi:hypothetical protein
MNQPFDLITQASVSNRPVYFVAKKKPPRTGLMGARERGTLDTRYARPVRLTSLAANP